MRVRERYKSGDVFSARVHHDAVAGPGARFVLVVEDAFPARLAHHGFLFVRRGGGIGEHVRVVRGAFPHSIGADERHLPADGDGVAAARADDGRCQLALALAAVAAVRAEARSGAEPARGPEAALGATALLARDGIDHLDRLTTVPNDEVVGWEDGVEAAAQGAEEHACPVDDGEREGGGAVAEDDTVAMKHERSWVKDGGVRRRS